MALDSSPGRPRRVAVTTRPLAPQAWVFPPDSEAAPSVRARALRRATMPPRETLPPPAVLHALSALVRPNTRVLELECGDGATCGAFVARRTRSYLGLDGHPLALEGARSRGLEVRLHAQGQRLPVGDASCDLLLALHAPMRAAELDRLLGECRRALRTGGHLVLSVPNAHYAQAQLRALLGTPPPWHRARAEEITQAQPALAGLTARSLRELLRTAGFVPQSLTAFDAEPSGPHAGGAPFTRLLAIALAAEVGPVARAALRTA